MTGPVVVRATPQDRAQVVATVVAAFTDDPAFRFFFPDDATYPRHATAFAGWLFDKRVREGTVRIIDGGAAVAMWDPPKGHFGTPAPPDLPPDVLRRIALYDEAIDDVFPSTPYWYLGVLAAHPDRAGQGLGRAVMAEGVQRAAAERVPAYLETTNERNVDLYERAGWEVVAVIPVEELDIRVMRNASGVARP